MKEAQRKALYLLGMIAGLIATVATVDHFHRSPAISVARSTNVVLQVSEVTLAHPKQTQLQFEGVEPAERINQDLMRRNREDWDRTHRRQIPR